MQTTKDKKHLSKREVKWLMRFIKYTIGHAQSAFESMIEDLYEGDPGCANGGTENACEECAFCTTYTLLEQLIEHCNEMYETLKHDGR